ncbi:hypothetical protein [Desulfosarcina sp.]|uniref:hypothetical protein n=1 Tax=Desulfosarcina sp. TaxID=2027861 RepID=UPI0029A4551C|nr:hypothetical protein [Desulfosarcina sp.]MDX2451080.1 hypothetical protein [Desulfosarcina sp.]MDX2488914.1 hypothetical protein [Desulfosarcina sp.]
MSSIFHKTVLLFVLILCGCGGGGDSAATPQISMGNFQTPINARLIHSAVFVTRVTINGSTNLDILVDTGSTNTYVPAQLFGNPGESINISSLCFENNVCIYDFEAFLSDSAFAQSKEGYYNGIIGMDLLKYFDLTFDYKNESILFYDALENGPSESVTIPIRYEGNRPFTNVSIEGLSQGITLLDTGAAYTRLSPIMLDSLSQLPTVLFTSFVFNFGVSESVEYLSLTDYCTGMACTDEIIVQIGSWHAVGGTFFREFLTVFNFTDNIVKLDRYLDNSHIKASGIQRSGVQIDIYDASQIIYVIEGGLAWEAGLRDGYEILSINGIPILSLGYFGIYDLLSDTTIESYQFVVINSVGDVEEFTIIIG